MSYNYHTDVDMYKDRYRVISDIYIVILLQSDIPEKYLILNCAIFYVCRLISSQKGRDFEKSEYNDIKRVYSVWVCMNMHNNGFTTEQIAAVTDKTVGEVEAMIARK